MKFAKYLNAESVPEWRKKYLDYRGLKKAIKRVEEARASGPHYTDSLESPTVMSVPDNVQLLGSRTRRLSVEGGQYGTLMGSAGAANSHGSSSHTALPPPHLATTYTTLKGDASDGQAPASSNARHRADTIGAAASARGRRQTSVAEAHLFPSREEDFDPSIRQTVRSATFAADEKVRQGSQTVPQSALRHNRSRRGVDFLRRMSISFGLARVFTDMSSRAPDVQSMYNKPASEMSVEEVDQAIARLMELSIPEESYFFEQIAAEIDMVERFYKENEAKLMGRFELLEKQCARLKAQELAQDTGTPGITDDSLLSPQFRKTTTSDSTTSTPDTLVGQDEEETPSKARPGSLMTPILTRLPQNQLKKLRHLSQNISQLQPSLSAVSSALTNRASMVGIINEDSRTEVHGPIAKRRLRKAFLEHYRGVRLLQNYCALNQTGFAKILKKFEKVTETRCSELFMRKIDTCSFSSAAPLQNTQGRAEELFSKQFEDGSRRRAMQLLRLPSDEKHSFRMPVFRFGLYIGLGLPAVIYSLVTAFSHGATRDSIDSRLLQIFSGFFLPVLFMMLFAINMRAWTKYHINYKFIFELDPRDHLDYFQFLEFPGVLFVIFAYCLALAVADPWPVALPAIYFPLIFLGIVAFLFLVPIKALYYSARRWSIIVGLRIFFSGLTDVQFRDFFIADELNSLIYLFTMLQLTTCTYATGWQQLDVNCNYRRSWVTPCIAALPPFWRLMQCLRRYFDSRMAFPHLANALKYLGAITVAFLAAADRMSAAPIWMVLWVIVSMMVTAYATFWDIYMDWGFFQRGSKNRFLRDELVFPYKSLYYFAIGSDLVLRAAWLLNISPSFWGIFYDHRVVAFVLAVLEVLRRFQWNFYRMENEHVNNCGMFRAIREIPLPFAIDQDADQHDESESSPTAISERTPLTRQQRANVPTIVEN